MLVVNLSYNENDFLKFKECYLDLNFQILDISNVLSDDNIKGLIEIKQLKKDNTILKKAINEMIDDIGKVSLISLNKNEQLRDINLNGLNLFWQTSISEKSPTRSFLINLYYLKVILEGALKFINFKEVYVILPSIKEAVYCVSISNFFLKNYNIQYTKFNFTEPKSLNYRAFCNKIWSNYIETSHFKRKINCFKSSRTGECFKNYVITLAQSPSWRNDRDRILGFVVDESINLKGAYLPYFGDLFANINWSNSWNLDYIYAFPSKLQMLGHYMSKYTLYRKIRKLKHVEGVNFIDGNVICSEFLEVLFKNYYFVNFLWLKNFFASISTPSNVFYYCEFYKHSGRVISQASRRVGNKHITTYGYQHGNIYEGHSVYHLTPIEFSNTKPFNGLPKPMKFIVWGNFFKKLINKYEGFNDDELIVAGNKNYINEFKKYKDKINENRVPTFLWCTTLHYIAQKEFEVIKPFLDTLKSYKLVVRCHPGYQIQNQVLNMFDDISKNNVTICDDKDLFEAIFKADCVIASNGSTIFMDALVLNRLVIKIQTDAIFIELVKAKNTFLVNSPDEIKNIYDKNYLNNTSKINLIDHDLLHLDDKKWSHILKNQLELT
jgi:hypothetical protein